MRGQRGLGDGGEFAGEAFEEGAEGGASAPADGSTSQRPGDVPVAYHLRYVHTDALGSPVLETNAIGEEIDGTRTQYEPYGAPLPTPHDGSPSYTGHQYDTGTGLIYAQQRYYDPQLGVFYSPDPMAVDTTSAFNFNRYAYANNSPYRFTDPDGRDAEDRFGDAFAANPDAFDDPIHNTFAIAATTVMVSLTGGPRAGMAFREVMNRKPEQGQTPPSPSSGPLKNRSGDVESAANAARSNPYPRRVSDHANLRLKTRDKAVMSESLETAISNGARTKDAVRETIKHDLPASQSPTGRGVTAVTNPRGDVVTVIDKGTKFEPKN